MNLARTYAIVFGAVYTLVGLIGFAVSSTLAVGTLILFPVNVLHNVVHLLVGVIGIAAFLTGRSVLYARGMAVLFAVLAVAGFLPTDSAGRFLGLVPIGGTDIVLHAATALLGGLAGFAFANNREERAVA
ncbi:MAG: DUF4383 domain-containing protein [Candidatus Dormibacter sp.]|uniref:DUF4383 domain-containing protein n=1 Tax=Candidatus Dormibacter sp. TaxID=2973982 RepID=UPI000DB079D7|nr:MAG: DUF4383 domain-containing protein [Candidatus Dormibacteraeota bacterium]